MQKKNTNIRLVIVRPDHSKGGLSIGNFRSGTDFLGKNPDKYENINIKERIVDSLKQIKWSGRKLAEMMLSDRAYISTDSIFKYYHLSPKEELVNALDCVSRIITQESLTATLQQILGNSFSQRNFIGWTTTGHTAEDVFLAIYASKRIENKTGVIDNSEIGRYIASLLDLGDLNKATETYFCKHTELFNTNEAKIFPDSLVIYRNNHRGMVKANSNLLQLDGKEVRLPTIAVFSNTVYFIPKQIVHYFN